ncbi:uncharacterized protein LOC126320412 [Schistocerca gregaria]|uniref:uncharacterized protein LOC126320412 n=1 Tax=Schistocerca gregaria TaxID=7010 RepID=UPI00211F08E2|nr:uncharacterized protein LOC126320412 [Schistocerca gregaria]
MDDGDVITHYFVPDVNRKSRLRKRDESDLIKERSNIAPILREMRDGEWQKKELDRLNKLINSSQSDSSNFSSSEPKDSKKRQIDYDLPQQNGGERDAASEDSAEVVCKKRKTNSADFVQHRLRELNRYNRSQRLKPEWMYDRASVEINLFDEKPFRELKLNPYLVSNMEKKLGYERPTLIQRMAIPTLMAGHDALIKAQTGSGKTLAYLIPIIEFLLSQSSNKALDTSLPSQTEAVDKTGVRNRIQKDDQGSLNRSSLDRDNDRHRKELIDSSSDPNSAVSSENEKIGRVATHDNPDTSLSSRPPYPSSYRVLGTQALILVPTRELALQIYTTTRQILQPFPHLVPGVIMGGEKRKAEKARLRKGVTILVATPGRLLDHINHTKSFLYHNCRWLVLDEGDRLLELGFEENIRSIIQALDSKSKHGRRSVLASATLNQHVQRLALLSLKNYVYLSSENSQDSNQNTLSEAISDSSDPTPFFSSGIYEIPATLKQYAVVIEEKRKLILLVAFLKTLYQAPKIKTIIFFSSRDSVEFYYMVLSNLEIQEPDKFNGKSDDEAAERFISANWFRLHGGLSQTVRMATYQSFLSSHRGILLCTDVAARGLDFPAVNWIIQYEVPSDPAAYIHRIGRTARIGANGNALVILFPSETEYLDILKKKQMMTIRNLSSAQILAQLNLEGGQKNSNKQRNILAECSVLQKKIEAIVNHSSESNEGLKKLAVNAFRSFVKSYATHTKSTKNIFHIKNLHLGHLAKNYGLLQPPSVFLSEYSQKGGKALQKKATSNRSESKPKFKSLSDIKVDEFLM